MGNAREVMDQFTEALTGTGDSKARTIAECFASDALAVTPDQGEIRGRENIVEYLLELVEAVPDATFESEYKHEAGNTAIDEGFLSGTNTGPVVLPSGETLPATGKEVRLRGCDTATVEDGQIVSYRLYFDQMDFLGQLGLLPDLPS
ncbi:ester cyclase [Streptomyces rectiviolaceus]|uniref:SnoaL-like domain-containing protein n=1 Tax=Streptomyces rectiviolaceus TaxID=332591 RepID=A0ABP6NGS6_9ACTN